MEMRRCLTALSLLSCAGMASSFATPSIGAAQLISRFHQRRPSLLVLKAPDDDLGAPPQVEKQANGTAAAAAAAAAWHVAMPYSDDISRALEDTRVEVFSGLLVFVGCMVFALETIPNLTEQQDLALTVLEYATCTTWAFFYMLRWYAANFDPRHVLRPIEIFDFISFAPLLSQPFSADPSAALYSSFAVLRSFRALRLQRFVADEFSFARLLRALKLRSDQEVLNSRELRLTLRVARVVSSILTLLFVSSGLIWEFEHLANPQIPTFFDALYFGLTTLTTVGYGDITPITFAGRLTVCLSIVVGVAVVPVQLAELGDTLFMDNQPLRENDKGETATDPDAAAAGTDTSRLLAFNLECVACGERVHLGGSKFCRICGGDVSSDGGAVGVVMPTLGASASVGSKEIKA
jgi:voltage-gated potassium channel